MSFIPLGATAVAKSGGSGLLGPIATGLGSLIGGLFGRSGQQSANQANLRIAREQMAFQRDMSNTAYQRAARDLEAAGLNRILALGNPASSPVGARAQMMNVNESLQKGIDQATANALQVRRLTSEIKVMESQARQADSQAELNDGLNDVALEDMQLRRQQKQESLSRYVMNMTQAQRNITGNAFQQQLLPGATAEGDLWRTLNNLNVDQFAKAYGLSAPVAKTTMMALRMILAGKRSK